MPQDGLMTDYSAALRYPVLVSGEEPQRSKHPRVFVSYSHESNEHDARVLDLSQRLRRDGIDARLDRYEPAPPQGWPRWMADQIRGADFVVLVCSPTYRRRFEGGEEPGTGRGVTFEGLIATQALYHGKLDLARLVPVCFESVLDDAIPDVLTGAEIHRLPSQYENLRGHLLGQLAIEPEPLGSIKTNSSGLPSELSLADQLSVLLDDIEERKIRGEDTNELGERLRALRREIRNGPLPAEGDILDARYRLVERSGIGGFATVWKAWDRHREDIVAVKVLHGQWSQDRSHRERFRSIIRRAHALDEHPAIVRMLGEPKTDDHHLFYVLRWFEGGDLYRAIFTRNLARDVGLLAIIRVLGGLAHAHAHGIIHRDIKPSNILLDAKDQGALADFDLARAADSTQGTRTGAMGTFIYAAPEQLRDASRVDARADIYSLGMVTLFVLARADPPPFVARMEPEFFDDLDCGIELTTALKLAVAYKPEERRITCGGLVEAIEAELGKAGDARSFAAIEARLQELEQHYCELETPLHDRGRTRIWAELGSLYAARHRPREVQLCFTQALWEQSKQVTRTQLTIARRWAEAEATMLGLPNHGHLLGLIDVVEAELDEQMIQALAAEVIYIDLFSRASMEDRAHHAIDNLAPSLPNMGLCERLRQFFATHGSLLDLRTSWLVRSALARFEGSDRLGLFRLRDEVMASLRAGAGSSHRVPAFVRRYRSNLTETEVERFVEELLRLRDEYRATKRRRSTIESTHPEELTHAYVHMIFGWGLARLGRPRLALEELGTAEGLLGSRLDRERGDPVHVAAHAAYSERVDQATAGLPFDAPFSVAPGGAVAVRGRLVGIASFKYDRLIEFSQILEPRQNVDAGKRWSRKDEPFAGIEFLGDSQMLASLFDQMLLRMPSLRKEQRTLELGRLFEYVEVLPSSIAVPILRRALRFAVAIPLHDRPPLLRSAIQLAAYYGTADLIADVLEALDESDANLTEQLPAEYAELLARCAPLFRRIGRESELATLLSKLEERIGAYDGVSKVLAQLRIAAGFAALGQPGRIQAAVQAANEVLPETLGIRAVYYKLLREIALTLGRGTPELAIAGARTLMARLVDTTDSMSTNSHYCLSVVVLMEAVVRCLANEDLVLGTWAELWIEEDEYLLRRRISRDLAG